MPLFTNENVVTGAVDANITNPSLPVTGPLTDAQLRATPVDINGTFTPSGTQDVNLVSTIPVPVTDNAGSLTVDGTVTVANPGLTDAQLRATPVPISGTVTASGPLTDTQLRATSVPVSGPLTDTQLRATVLPVSESGANATVAQVVLSANTNTTILAANANRKGVVIFTVSQPVYIKYGATASTTSWTHKVSSNNVVTSFDNYNGRIDILSQAGQTINVTEITA